jgi:CubicO group peptidase (beta-lactamase class C family)
MLLHGAAQRSRLAAMLICLLATTSCGGGGGGGPPSGGLPPPAPTPTPAPTPPPPPPAPTPTPPPAGTLNFQAAADYATAAGARAVVAIRQGQVVIERYANGGSAGRGETLASGTKSFTCVLAAAGEDDGFFNVEEAVATVLPPWGPGGSAPQNNLKQQIRAIDLLSVTSGLALSGSAGGGLNDVDSYAQVVGATSLAAPNTATIYNPNNAQGFSMFFELKTGGRYNADGSITGGQDGINYLKTRVFDRIGIATTDWSRDIKGKPNFAGGAEMTALNWARFGQFMEQFGQWNGQQIVSSARLQRCVDYRSGAFHGYGLGWWLNRPVGNSYVATRDNLPWNAEVTGRWAAGGKLAPSAPDDMFVAFGAGQRKLYVIPSQDLVIVRIGGPTEEDRFFQLLYGTP